MNAFSPLLSLYFLSPLETLPGHWTWGWWRHVSGDRLFSPVCLWTTRAWQWRGSVWNGSRARLLWRCCTTHSISTAALHLCPPLGFRPTGSSCPRSLAPEASPTASRCSSCRRRIVACTAVSCCCTADLRPAPVWADMCSLCQWKVGEKQSRTRGSHLTVDGGGWSPGGQQTAVTWCSCCSNHWGSWFFPVKIKSTQAARWAGS